MLLVALTFAYPYISSFYLQVEGNGNCLFSAVKRSLGVWNRNHPDHPYYPTRYFHHQVVVWLVQNRQRVWFNEHIALESNYGFEETTPSYTGPLMYKSYCRALLKRDFWGDEVVLYTISCMWNLHITVFNSHTDQEYRVRHGAIMDKADVNLVLNGRMCYSTGGKLPFHLSWSPV